MCVSVCVQHETPFESVYPRMVCSACGRTRWSTPEWGPGPTKCVCVFASHSLCSSRGVRTRNKIPILSPVVCVGCEPNGERNGAFLTCVLVCSRSQPRSRLTGLDSAAGCAYDLQACMQGNTSCKSAAAVVAAAVLGMAPGGTSAAQRLE